ncbi:MAG: 2Fe-2S iron-sulfur cluster-binding protein, partial [Chloroflexota bacterium]
MNIRFEPTGVRAQVEAGRTILDAANAAGVEIESVCGGRGTCAKCKVIAASRLAAASGLSAPQGLAAPRGLAPPRALAAPTALELRGLSADELARGYRLACQAVIVGDVDVVVP